MKEELKTIAKVVGAFFITVGACLGIMFMTSPIVPNPNALPSTPQALNGTVLVWLTILLEVVVFIGWWRRKR